MRSLFRWLIGPARRFCQIKPNTMKIPISVRKATLVMADVRNRSPTDGNCMARLVACQAPAGKFTYVKKVSVPQDQSKHLARYGAAAGKRAPAGKLCRSSRRLSHGRTAPHPRSLGTETLTRELRRD